jgi:hypothetical protein
MPTRSAVLLRAVRFSVLVVGAALVSQAPLQCSHEPEPDVRRYETPPEALYALATRFKAKGNESGYRGTLEYLVERYPNSRFAMRAKDELKVPPAVAGSAVPEP